MITPKVKPYTQVHSKMSSQNTKHQLSTPTTITKAKEEAPSSILRSMVGDAAKFEDFRKPSENDISSYDVEIVRAIRSNNLARLKELYLEGRSMNACNQFGESLVHMVCRRGDTEILKFMIEEANVCFKIKDDFGRNPFHDACWTSTPNFEIMDLLIEATDTSLLLSEDVRGNTPFDYTRREHYSKWSSYLDSRKTTILNGLNRNRDETTN